ncbi:hypothetical protein B5P46_08270 [Rhizobium leguminosarum]|uniref:Uncharacterized protein n=1 Tax=Rhizobium leguminosarum TaxID=384 RepID=A0A4Q1UF01_RHILE|nr:hypothetical protein B5P46_08270 [Rhizobium leguminosarum]
MTTKSTPKVTASRNGVLLRRLEHDAEKCARFSDDIMLLLFKLRTGFEIFRPMGPEIILF